MPLIEKMKKMVMSWIEKMKNGEKSTWKLEEEQQQLLQLVEQLPAELRHPGENVKLHFSSKIGNIQFIFNLISSHLGVCKPWWEAVSKGGSGVGSQVGSSLTLHTGFV